jgi:ABC-type branched-subunit amino acid transport system substrate-binding protein
MRPCTFHRALTAAIAALIFFAASLASAQIRIGQTIDLSGSTAEHGKAIVAGINAYLDPLNAKGGIGGKKIVLITLDDGGKGDLAAKNTVALIDKHSVLTVFSGAEGGPCLASMKVAIARKVSLLGCASGAPEFRDPFNRYIFPIRAGHMDEFAVLLDHAKQFGRTRVAFLHADSDSGRKHLANVKRLAAERNLEVALELVLKSGADAETPTQMAEKIVQQKIDVIFNHGSYGTYANVLTEARRLKGQTLWLAVNSGAQQMVRLLGTEANGMVFTQVVPFPWSVSLPIVKEYQKAMKVAAPKDDFSFSSMEGYLNAKLLVAAIRLAGNNPTREGLITALEKAGTIDLGGVTVTYSSAAHEGSKFVDTVLAKNDGRFVTH